MAKEYRLPAGGFGLQGGQEQLRLRLRPAETENNGEAEDESLVIHIGLDEAARVIEWLDGLQEVVKHTRRHTVERVADLGG